MLGLTAEGNLLQVVWVFSRAAHRSNGGVKELIEGFVEDLANFISY